MKMLVRNMPVIPPVQDRVMLEIFGAATRDWPGILWTNIRVPMPLQTSGFNVGHMMEDSARV